MDEVGNGVDVFDYANALGGLVSKLRRRKLLRKPPFAEVAEGYADLERRLHGEAKLKGLEGLHAFRALCLVAGARCQQALGAADKEASRNVKAARALAEACSSNSSTKGGNAAWESFVPDIINLYMIAVQKRMSGGHGWSAAFLSVELGDALSQLGLWSEASSVLKGAAQVPTSTPPACWSVPLLQEAGQCAVLAGELERARTLFRSAISAIEREFPQLQAENAKSDRSLGNSGGSSVAIPPTPIAGPVPSGPSLATSPLFGSAETPPPPQNVASCKGCNLCLAYSALFCVEGGGLRDALFDMKSCLCVMFFLDSNLDAVQSLIQTMPDGPQCLATADVWSFNALEDVVSEVSLTGLQTVSLLSRLLVLLRRRWFDSTVDVMRALVEDPLNARCLAFGSLVGKLQKDVEMGEIMS